MYHTFTVRLKVKGERSHSSRTQTLSLDLCRVICKFDVVAFTELQLFQALPALTTLISGVHKEDYLRSHGRSIFPSCCWLVELVNTLKNILMEITTTIFECHKNKLGSHGRSILCSWCRSFVEFVNSLIKIEMNRVLISVILFLRS